MEEDSLAKSLETSTKLMLKSRTSECSVTKKKPTQNRLNLLELPREILIEILRRLPLSAIVQCSACNNKELCNLIIKEFAYQATVFAYSPHYGGTFLIQYDVDHKNIKFVPINLNFVRGLENPKKTPFRVLASCSGWLLFHIDPQFNQWLLLVNPLTRRSIVLPNDTINVPDFYQSGRSVYGIGCSRTTGRFKVVRLTKMTHTRLGYRSRYVEILDLGCSSQEFKWRRMDRDDNLVQSAIVNYPVSINGAIHWLVKSTSNIILRFDIDKEGFDLIRTPSSIKDWKIDFLGSIGNSLCVSIMDHKSRYRETWVMKEFGVQESWTLLCSMEHDYYGRPIQVLEDKTILFTSFQSEELPESDSYNDHHSHKAMWVRIPESKVCKILNLYDDDSSMRGMRILPF